ncbi:MAG: sigma-70 family polymerase sigma factor [Desulfacinum sp.]|nr:sigma-70 family polymerase sigma factor [Desulfacinum sp.]
MAGDAETGKAMSRVAGRADAKGEAGVESDAGAPSPDDRELVRRARGGDRDAMERLMALYYPRVLATAFRLCDFDRGAAEEAAQEAMLNVFRRIGQFEERSAFSTWLYRIVVNTCLMERRKKKRRFSLLKWWPTENSNAAEGSGETEGGFAWSGTSSAAAVAHMGLQRDVLRALRSLSERQRTVFVLKVFEEMTLQEIAEVTGMALGTVKTHLVRAMKTMRRHLRDYGEDR